MPLTAAAAQKPQEYRPNFYLAEALLTSGAAGEGPTRLRSCAGELNPQSAAAKAGLGRALGRQAHLDRKPLRISRKQPR